MRQRHAVRQERRDTRGLVTVGELCAVIPPIHMMENGEHSTERRILEACRVKSTTGVCPRDAQLQLRYTRSRQPPEMPLFCSRRKAGSNSEYTSQHNKCEICVDCSRIWFGIHSCLFPSMFLWLTAHHK